MSYLKWTTFTFGPVNNVQHAASALVSVLQELGAEYFQKNSKTDDTIVVTVVVYCKRTVARTHFKMRVSTAQGTRSVICEVQRLAGCGQLFRSVYNRLVGVTHRSTEVHPIPLVYPPPLPDGIAILTPELKCIAEQMALDPREDCQREGAQLLAQLINEFAPYYSSLVNSTTNLTSLVLQLLCNADPLTCYAGLVAVSKVPTLLGSCCDQLKLLAIAPRDPRSLDALAHSKFAQVILNTPLSNCDALIASRSLVANSVGRVLG